MICSNQIRGFSLIEVLLAIFIMSSTFTLALEQITKCHHYLTQLYFKHIALEQALSLVESLKVNHEVNYCQREIANWQQANAELLPKGKGSFRVGALIYSVTLFWQAKGDHKATFKIPA